MALSAQYRLQVTAIHTAAATLRARGSEALSRAKDKYLKYLTRAATHEEPPHPNRPGEPEHKAAVVVMCELVHSSQARRALNDGQSVAGEVGGFVIARLRTRIESDTDSSKVMERHVHGKSLSDLARLGLPVKVQIEPARVVYEIDKHGVAQRNGDVGYYARFAHGLLPGDPPAQRGDLSGRSPERGELVLEHVLALMRQQPIGALLGHVVRKL